MKVFELLSHANTQPELLVEKLGNLSQLKAGKLINVLRQGTYGRSHLTASEDGSKFSSIPGIKVLGTESEIVDAGVIKKGISDLRKAYRQHGGEDEDVAAFALYVDGQAVAVGRFSTYDLAGSSRFGLLAYDLTPVKDALSPKAKVTSAKQEENWRTGKMVNFTGEITTTAALGTFIEKLLGLAGDKRVTCKLVLADKELVGKRRERHARLTGKEVFTGLEALNNRLKKFKLSKMPTADTIDEFIEKAKTETGKAIQFAGRTFSTTPRSYGEKIDPIALLSGKEIEFDVSYENVEPGEYDSLLIYYVMKPKTGSIAPWKAVYNSKVDDKLERVTAVLDHERYLKRHHGVKDASDKNDVMKALLTRVKNGEKMQAKEMISALRQAKKDWPELDVVEKSLNDSK